jgi:hypothetical protein
MPFRNREHWRFRAEEARTVADQMTHEVARTIMRRIAIDYDRLAKLAEASEPERGMAKKYPVLYTILVWIGIMAFGLVMFCGMYILSGFLRATGRCARCSSKTARQSLRSALRASSISACHCGATARHSHR